jgi:hypothetical protein
LLLAGPNWNGEKPDGIKAAIRDPNSVPRSVFIAVTMRESPLIMCRQKAFSHDRGPQT